MSDAFDFLARLVLRMRGYHANERAGLVTYATHGISRYEMSEREERERRSGTSLGDRAIFLRDSLCFRSITGVTSRRVDRKCRGRAAMADRETRESADFLTNYSARLTRRDYELRRTFRSCPELCVCSSFLSESRVLKAALGHTSELLSRGEISWTA